MNKIEITPAKVENIAWLVVGLLFPVALLNYLDRQMIASMKISVMNDIPDIGTEANWGLMLGKFKFVYAVCSPIGGYIADRFSRKLTICSPASSSGRRSRGGPAMWTATPVCSGRER